MQNISTPNPNCLTLNLVFYFAENVFLPSMKEQPGNLYFLIGLCFEIFVVYSRIMKCSYVFGILEGYWQNEKSVNEVIYMLYYVLHLRKSQKTYNNFVLHADNCTGQKNNGFVLWYMCWLAMYVQYHSVRLVLIIAIHTKILAMVPLDISRGFFER